MIKLGLKRILPYPLIPIVFFFGLGHFIGLYISTYLQDKYIEELVIKGVYDICIDNTCLPNRDKYESDGLCVVDYYNEDIYCGDININHKRESTKDCTCKF